jgi:hypothetical protein
VRDISAQGNTARIRIIRFQRAGKANTCPCKIPKNPALVKVTGWCRKIHACVCLCFPVYRPATLSDKPRRGHVISIQLLMLTTLHPELKYWPQSLFSDICIVKYSFQGPKCMLALTTLQFVHDRVDTTSPLTTI